MALRFPSPYAQSDRDDVAHDESRRDPEVGRPSLGVLVAVVVSMPVWMLILWLIL
jgi:hypothetical protein